MPTRVKPGRLPAMIAGVLTATTLLAACVQATERGGTATPAPTPAATSTPTATPTPEPEPTATATPQPEPEHTATPSPTPLPTATPSPTPVQVGSNPTHFGLFLEIHGLTDQAVVRGNIIVVSGMTSPDAVLSINGVIVPVGSDGRFEVTLALDDGPNLLEVVSSDLSGHQESRVLWVVALPPEGV